MSRQPNSDLLPPASFCGRIPTCKSDAHVHQAGEGKVPAPWKLPKIASPTPSASSSNSAYAVACIPPSVSRRCATPPASDTCRAGLPHMRTPSMQHDARHWLRRSSRTPSRTSHSASAFQHGEASSLIRGSKGCNAPFVRILENPSATTTRPLLSW